MFHSNTAEPSPFALLLKSAPPLILRGAVISGCQFFAKRAIYGQEDESILAAYGLYSIIEGFVFLIVFRGLRIISAKTSHLYTQEKIDPSFNPLEIGVLYRQGVLLGIILMMTAAALCVSAPAIFSVLGQPEAIIQGSSSYFFYGFLGYFGDMLYRSRARIDIGRSQPSYALVGDIVESLIDAAGTYVLVRGTCGFPKMGVNGGAIAYALATWITAIGYNLRSYLNTDLEKYSLYCFSMAEYRKTLFSAEFKEIFWGGVQIALKFSIVYLTLGITTVLCNQKGEGSTVGLSATGAYSNLVVLPIGGFSEAASVVIGGLYKKNLQNEAKRMGNVVILISTIFASVCASLLFGFINPITRIFIADDAAHVKDFAIVKNFLLIQALMEIPNSIGNVSASALSGYLKTQYPFLSSVAFIFALNTVLTVMADFLFHQDTETMYAVQMIGIILNSTGIFMQWKKQGRTILENDAPLTVVYQTTQSIWQTAGEDQRHPASNELLPV